MMQEHAKIYSFPAKTKMNVNYNLKWTDLHNL